jgi:hypothetical protein
VPLAQFARTNPIRASRGQLLGDIADVAEALRSVIVVITKRENGGVSAGNTHRSRSTDI